MGVVVAYDSWALKTGNETLTGGFARIAEKRVGRIPVGITLVGSWLGLTWHLVHGRWRLLPEPWHLRYKRMHPLWRLHDHVQSQRIVSIVTPIGAPQANGVETGVGGVFFR